MPCKRIGPPHIRPTVVTLYEPSLLWAAKTCLEKDIPYGCWCSVQGDIPLESHQLSNLTTGKGSYETYDVQVEDPSGRDH